MITGHSAPADDVLSQMERLIHQDPARRGLLDNASDPLTAGHLPAAVDHLSRFAEKIWILTGFFVPSADPPAAETDGPPGAAFLAAVLQGAGYEVRILTDSLCLGAVACAAQSYGVSPGSVIACPSLPGSIAVWCDHLDQQSPRQLSHVISIERVGPGYDPQCWSQSDLSEEFAKNVPIGHWGRCHNMRGEIIDDVTPPLHEVLEWVARRHPAVKTIGIGDGGNELGMGSLTYQTIRQRLVEPAASRIPCRIATDWTILAGVSNWGAIAIAAALCWKWRRLELVSGWGSVTEEQRLYTLVTDGPAVDGVTRLPQPTVDGLPIRTYLQPWEAMRSLLQLDRAESRL